MPISSDDLVSVVMPMLNRADVVGESVRSVLEQTHDHLELVVVDDGSEDRSVEVVEAFADPRVRIIRLPTRGGAPRARNVGIAHSRGRYVAFQDSDDVWHPEKLAMQVETLAAIQPELRVVAVGCEGLLYGVPLSRPGSRFEVRLGTRQQVLAGIVTGLGTPKLMIDRSRAAEGAAFDPGFPAQQDRDFLLSCLGPKGKVAVIQHPLVSIRRRRDDHIAAPHRAAQGHLRYVEKYSDELAEMPNVRRWYLYSAMREELRAGDRASASRHLVSLRSPRRIAATLPEFVLGQMLGDTGLKVAARCHLRPNWDGRVDPRFSIEL